MIIAVIDAIFAAGKRKPEKKIQGCKGFEPLTSAIPVQRSYYKMSQQANCQHVVELIPYKPVKG